MGQTIEIYARPGVEPATPASPSIRLLAPASNAVVTAQNGEFRAEGMAVGAESGWFALVEVFTNRWYAQGNNIPLAPDGSFRQVVTLGGQERQQCYHLLRARLFDAGGRSRAATINSGVTRANADGSAPACRPAK